MSKTSMIFTAKLLFLVIKVENEVRREAGKVVHLTQTQMDEINFIFVQSQKGLHLLFDNDTIKKYLSKKVDEVDLFNDDSLPGIEQLVEEFISTPTISARKQMFNEMNEEEKELVIRSYFNIIENNIVIEGRNIN